MSVHHATILLQAQHRAASSEVLKFARQLRDIAESVINGRPSAPRPGSLGVWMLRSRDATRCAPRSMHWRHLHSARCGRTDHGRRLAPMPTDSTSDSDLLTTPNPSGDDQPRDAALAGTDLPPIQPTRSPAILAPAFRSSSEAGLGASPTTGPLILSPAQRAPAPF
jgi:hypothetical protein